MNLHNCSTECALVFYSTSLISPGSGSHIPKSHCMDSVDHWKYCLLHISISSQAFWDKIECPDLTQIDFLNGLRCCHGLVWMRCHHGWTWLEWGIAFNNLCLASKLTPCWVFLSWEVFLLFIWMAWLWIIYWDSCLSMEYFNQINIIINIKRVFI